MGIFKSSRRKPAPRGKASTTATPKARYEAVEIQYSGEACRAAQDAAGQRYLCAKAPLLPLPDCDRPDRCSCRYARYTDRRQNPRRKSEGALPTESQVTQDAERRRDQGRRAEELDMTGRQRAWIKDSW